MFAEQVKQLNALRGKLDDSVIDVLVSMMGQCASALEHRGPVVIDMHPERMRSAPCHTISEGEQGAALTVKAYGSSYTRDPDQVGEGRMCGPAVASFYGLVYIRPGPDNFGLVTKCIDAECVFGDGADFNNLTVNEILNARTARWAVATGNWKYAADFPSAGGGHAWVTVQECLDAAGNGPFGNEFDVWVPVGSGQDPNVVEDQVIAIQKTASGWVCESAADDAIGTVKFWASVEEPGEKDEVLPGWRAVKREPADDLNPTRSETTWTLHPDFDFTWPVATDEVGNIFSHGGSSTHDHEPHTPGDTAGSEIDDHLVAGYTTWSLTGITVGPHDEFETEDAYAEIYVDDHPPHFHEFASIRPAVDGAGFNVPVRLDGATDTGGPTDVDGYPTYLDHEVTDPGHSHLVYPLYHDVYDPTHRHYFAQILEHDFRLPHSEEDHLPPYVALWLIERVNNGVPDQVFGGGGP